MKYIIIFIVAFFSCISVQSQTIEELQKQKEELLIELQSLQDCFDEQSEPDSHKRVYKINGMEVPVLERTDFHKESYRFSQVDPNLNVRYMVMDRKNLSQWESANADKICSEYFDGGSGFHIAAHGLADNLNRSQDRILLGDKYLGPEETAEMILQCLNNYELLLRYRDNQPFPIVLHCCNLGGGEDSFAAKLSRILYDRIDNVAVVASPGVVNCTLDENGYNETIDPNKNTNSKKWQVFVNGKKSEGSIDYKSTVLDIKNVFF